MTETSPSAVLPHWLTPARLDRFEQVVIVLLWALLAHRVLDATNPLAPLTLISETTVVLFVLVRRPTEAISLRLGDWLLAATATWAPLMIMPASMPAAMQSLMPVAFVLILVGNVVQIAGKLFLFRSFGIAPANRGIKRDGLYRLVRHPIYAGYMVVHIGLLMAMPSLINAAVYGIAWWAQILRLLAEERLLSEDPDYRDYMTQTRWRLLPGVF